MKPGFNRFIAVSRTAAVTLAVTLLSSYPALAATRTWDGGDTGGTNDTASGGSGTWNTTGLAWDDGVVNSLNVAWSNAAPDSAIFGNTAGTVTLGAAITAGSITFNTSGYTLNTNGNALTATNLAGSGNFTKTGTGDFTINTGSSYTGALTLSGGRLLFTNAAVTTYKLGSLTTGNDVFVNNGSTLQLDNGTLNFTNTNFWIQSSGTVGKITSGTGSLTVTNAVTDYNAITDQAIRVQIVDGASALQLIKAGGGNLRIDQANTYTGGTAINAGRLELQANGTLGTGAVTIASGSSLMFSGNSLTHANNITVSGLGATESGGQLGAIRFGSNTATLTGSVTLAGDTRIGADATGILSGVVSGGFGIEKTRAGTLTLSGANTYTGATTVSAGTLVLDYSVQDNSKLSNSSALSLANGTTLTLAGATGSHAEALGSFSATGVTSITRSGLNTATIGLGNFTNTGLLNIAATGLATTTRSNNASGYLNGVTLAGTQLAANDGSGNIIGLATYTDVTRLSSGTKVIPSGAGSVVRIIDGTGTAANITAAAGTVDIQTLFQTSTATAATVDLTSSTLRLGAAGEILTGSGSSALTVQNGTLTAGGAANTAGEIFAGAGGGAINITSSLADNGTGAVSVRSSGTVTLTKDANTYTGGTTVNGGTLTASATTTAGAKTTFGTGSITVNNGTIRFFTGGTSNALSYANAINLNGSTLTSEDGIVTYGGAVALTGSNTVNVVWGGKNAIFSNVISGAGSLTKTGTGDMLLNGNNTYTGGTTFSGGATQLGNAGALGTTGTLTFGGGTLRYTSSNTTDYSSRFSTVSGQAYSVDTNSQSVTWATALTSLGGSLTKSGAGTLTLSATNTYTGNTTIQNGTLSVGSIANNLGTSTASITLGVSGSTTGTLLYTGSGETTARGLVLNGAGVVTNNGSGLLKFNGAVTNTSAAATQTLTVGGSNNGEIAGIISNNGTTSLTSLVKNDAGTWALSATNTYTGGTTVNAGVLNLTGGGGSAGTIRGTVTVNSGGTLRLSTGDATGYTAGTTSLGVINITGGTMDVNTTANQTLGGATINMTGGSITGIANSNLDFFGGASTLNTLASATTSVISGVKLSPNRQGATTFTTALGTTASGIDLDIQSVIQTSPAGDAAGVFTKAGAGTLAFSGNNTFAHDILISAGTLMVGNGGTSGSLGTGAVVNNSALSLNRSDSHTVANAISGTGTLIKRGAGTATLTANNSYGGTTTITAGTLQIGSGSTTGSLGTGAVTNSGTLAFNRSNAMTVSNTISGTGAVTHIGSGTTTLTGVNNYSGTTTVTGGTLRFNGNSSAATGAVSVASGATLGGTGSIGGAVNVTGTLAPGASVESLATGAVTFNTGSTFAVEMDSSVAASSGSDLLVANGNLALSGVVNLTLTDLATLAPAAPFANGTVFSIVNYTGTWNGGYFTFAADTLTEGEQFHALNNDWVINYQNTTPGQNFTGDYVGGQFVTLTVVPEPGVALLGGLGALMLFRRRRVV